MSFLLGMRNRRRGLVAPLDAVLVRWIDAAYHDIRPTNKARKRTQLRSIIERRRLMVIDTTMTKDLMLIKPNITKQEMIEEAAKLYAPRYLPIKRSCVCHPRRDCSATVYTHQDLTIYCPSAFLGTAASAAAKTSSIALTCQTRPKSDSGFTRPE